LQYVQACLQISSILLTVAVEGLAPDGYRQAEVHLFRDGGDVYRTLEYCHGGLNNMVHKSRTGLGRDIGKSEQELLGLLGIDSAVLSLTKHQQTGPKQQYFETDTTGYCPQNSYQRLQASYASQTGPQHQALPTQPFHLYPQGPHQHSLQQPLQRMPGYIHQTGFGLQHSPAQPTNNDPQASYPLEFRHQLPPMYQPPAIPQAGFNIPAMAPTSFPPIEPIGMSDPTASNQHPNYPKEGFECRGIYLGDLPDSLWRNTKALQWVLGSRLVSWNVRPWQKLEFGNMWNGKHNAYLEFKSPDDAYWAIRALKDEIIGGGTISAQWHRYRGRYTKDGVLA
jgi:hypothetical protein